MSSSGSSWHRWQLTSPLAALSRPVRSRGSDTVATAPGTPPPAPAGELERDGLPVLLGGARARQTDPTTCGAAVLVMLAATGDPALADWLETGQLPDGEVPPEIPAELAGQGADDPGAPPLDAAARFAAAQREVARRTGRAALGPLRWPAALGTPPWTAAREARFAGARYRVRPVDDSSAEAPHLLALVEAATRRGHPVPLYTGGDLRRGLSHAVPRHVVLAVPPPPGAGAPGVLQVYEPGRGSVFQVPLTALLDRTEPHPALGDWTHVTVALLPVPA